MKIKVLELFAGIGACSKALKNIGIDVEIIDAVEIDKYAIKSFNVVHNTNFEPQDITKWDKDIEVDLITHGSPCQDFSVAGKQAGGDKDSGTRSSLMYETIRIVEKLKPKYVLWENVKNLLSKKHRHNFDAYIETMNKLGYNSYFQVLNAKDYGIPQNRERVYTISIRKDLDKGYIFPEKEQLKLKLKDMLEDKVDEKYYLSNEQVTRIKESTFTQSNKRLQEKIYCDTLLARDYKDPKCVVADFRYDEGLRVRKEEISPCLTTKIGSPSLSGNTYLLKDGIDITWNEVGKTTDVSRALTTACRTLSKNQMSTGILEIGNYSPSGHSASRVVDVEGIAPTVMENHGTATAVSEKQLKTKNKRIQKLVENTDFSKEETLFMDIYNQKNINNISGTLKSGMDHQQGNIIYNNLRIRKLTPLECWRLMGFDDEDFYKAEKVNSNTQLYKQAGNSIVVKVLEKIFSNLFYGVDKTEKTLFDMEVEDE